MKIKRKLVDNRVELTTLWGFIRSSNFCSKIFSASKEDVEHLFSTNASQTIVRICRKYWKKYKKAPGSDFIDLVKVKAESMVEDQAEVLIKLSEKLMQKDFGEFNQEFAIDQAETYLRERTLNELSSRLRGELMDGNIEGAENMLIQYRRPCISQASGIDSLTDVDAIHDAFELEYSGLFSFSGELGRLLNRRLEREGLIGIQAPEKTGKTFWLFEGGIRAALARRNVAFFEVGDMSQNQIIRRQGIRLAGKSDEKMYCGELSYPVLDCKLNQNDSCKKEIRTGRCGIQCDVDGAGVKELWEMYGSGEASKHRPCSICEQRKYRSYRGSVWWKVRPAVTPLNWREAVKVCRQFSKRLKNRHFKLSVHPSNSITVSGIENIIRVWEDQEGWSPDVIIIDYADILAPEDKNKTVREQINETWMALRKMSQERHCLVLVATQSSARAYGKFRQGMGDFGESKQKYAHVTGMLALNQTSEEKEAGIMRVGWLLVREGEAHVTKEVNVLQCLQMGRPCLASFR